jgi:hypothetical protein
MDIFFVWVDGLRGPSPQLWFGDKTENMLPVKTLFKRRLDPAEDAGATFEILQAKYPAPAAVAEPKIRLPDLGSEAREASGGKAGGGAGPDDPANHTLLRPSDFAGRGPASGERKA